MRYIHTFRGRLAAAALSTLLVASCFTHQVRAGQCGYVVQPNDTLSGIAARFGTTVPALMVLNHLSKSGFIVAGQTLLISGAYGAAATAPVSSMSTGGASVTYVVRVGDTLSAISGRFGVAFQSVASLNALVSPYVIRAGQTLMIPATSDNPSLAAAAAAQSVAATSAPVTGGMVYTVAQGDTLGGLSKRFGVTTAAIAAANHLSMVNLITIGQQLVIPAVAASATTSSGIAAAAPATSVAPANTSASTGAYVVRAGDTLSAIAQRFGMTTDAVAAQNNISADAIIAVGEQLVVPAGSVAPSIGQEPFVDKATIANILTAEAQRAGVDPGLIKGLAWQESGWQMVTATDGGMGVMQLMPDSVDWAGGTLLGQTIDPFNATDNIRAGVAMMSYYLKVYDGDPRRALAAYHQGMASVDNEGIRPDTEQYIANILALQQQFGG